MSIIKFVHAADLHLDSPFKGIQKASGEVGERLREATFQAYGNIVGLCIRERVDALLIAGDIFDGADRSIRAQVRFQKGLQQLADNNIRVFLCHGNHDPLDSWSSAVKFPGNCVRFTEEVTSVPVFPGDAERAIVTGYSYPKREVVENVITKFDTALAKNTIQQAQFSIGLLHANVGNNRAHSNYAPCSLEDLQRVSAIDYWSLGHIHKHDILHQTAPTVVYSGNSQGRHINEQGERGVYLVTAHSAEDTELKFVPTDVVRWVSLALSIEGLESIDELPDKVHEAITTTVSANQGRDLVFRLTLIGRGPLHSELTLAKTDELAEAINDRSKDYAAPPHFAWCERVVSRAVPDFDIEAHKTSEDFTGEVLRVFTELANSPEELANIQNLLSEELYKSTGKINTLMSKLELNPSKLGQIIASAEHKFIDLLLKEDNSQ